MLSNKFSLLQPPCPACGGQPATDRRIIIILVIVLIIVTGLYISDYKMTSEDTSWNIICRAPESTVIKNNIQATHTYDWKNFKEQDKGVFLDGVDDWGDLYGNSMAPTFFEGNTVLLKNYTIDMKLKTGYIVRFFRKSETYPECKDIRDAVANNALGGAYVNTTMAIIHRIAAVYDDTIIVQGDNLNEQEVIEKCQITDIIVGIIYT